jgi:3-deoxy-7-phosphoheptulonate synthase
VGPARFGPGVVSVIAGPCAVESRAQYLEAARRVREAGAVMLRGGAWKPRTSPYAFQGLGPPGLDILEEARAETGLPIVTEALDEESLERVASRADMIQIGSRNMHNFSLLRRVARSGLPILLKRGMSATVEDLLSSAEYLLAEGNPHVVLCERGIRTFSTHSRFTLDLGVVPILRERTHLPVVVDPSHASGERGRVPSLSLAAVAAGADGLMVEVHAEPEAALCDGPQALRPEAFEALMARVRKIAPVVGREVGAVS